MELTLAAGDVMAADSSFVPAGDATAQALDKLQADGAITAQDIDQAHKLTDRDPSAVLVTLNQIGVVSDDRLARTLASITGLDVFDEGDLSAAFDEQVPLNPDFMRDTMCLLTTSNGPLLVVNPLDDRIQRAVEFALGETLPRKIIRVGDWRRLFEDVYPASKTMEETLTEDDDPYTLELEDHARDAPVTRQVSAWLHEAADLGASDVHFVAKKNAFEVLYRLDGTLRSVSVQQKSAALSILTRIKVMADLDLGERFKAQDGRTTIVVRGRRLDVRVSIIPTINGESAVIRLLDRDHGLLSLNGLGFSQSIQRQLSEIMQKRHGMFVVAGPTGSGKTTTLYACVEKLKGTGLKILSVEDPVEYQFDHVSQVQVSEKAGRTFAGALRAFLRHDPDVILVGEIRDPETAAIAAQAALSGHLVLATIHAIDSARIRTRLIDMGIEPFKLDACLVGSMTQRLVRRLCPKCRQSTVPSSAMKSLFDKLDLRTPEKEWTAPGCAACNWEGYKGRIALADFSTEQTGEPSQSLEKAALELLERGETTLSEVGALLG